MDLSPQELKKLEKLAKVLDGGDVALLGQIDNLEEKVDAEISKVQAVVSEALSIAEQTKKMQGERGEDGKDGATGEKGDRGERGEKGDPGAPGKDGKDGAPGRDGIDGRDGKDGEDGKDGADGFIDEATIAYLEEGIKKVEEAVVEVKAKHTNFGRVIREIQAGTNITVDSSDPNRPIVSASGVGGVTDHGALTGLADDDHTQYAKKVESVDIEITDTAKGIILKSANGTRWRIGITNNGELTAVSL
jgi:hypothetical protein